MFLLISNCSVSGKSCIKTEFNKQERAFLNLNSNSYFFTLKAAKKRTNSNLLILFGCVDRDCMHN